MWNKFAKPALISGSTMSKWDTAMLPPQADTVFIPASNCGLRIPRPANTLKSAKKLTETQSAFSISTTVNTAPLTENLTSNPAKPNP